MDNFQIAPGTHIGFVALRVADLQSMSDFYTKIVGLAILKQTTDTVYLGIRRNQQVLLTLRQIEGQPSTHFLTGLLRLAVLLPQMRQLAGALKHMQRNNIKITGSYETQYSQSFEIEDPEGTGVVFTVDKPKQLWQQFSDADWAAQMTENIAPEILAKDNTANFRQLPSGTALSYLQLRVKDLAASIHFYTLMLGFTPRPTPDDRTTFLAAGDYHHHFSLTEEKTSKTAKPLPDGRGLGLDFVDLVLPNVNAMADLAAHLQQQGLSDFDYAQQNHYLMLTDPNQLRLWFTVA